MDSKSPSSNMLTSLFSLFSNLGLESFTLKDIQEVLQSDEAASIVEKATVVKVKTVSSKLKDPNAPKRAASAWILFSSENRSEVKESLISQGKDSKFGDITKELSRIWKNLSEDEKEPYETRSNALKEQYKEKMKDYVRPDDSELKDLKENNKKPRAKRSASSKSKEKKPADAPKGNKNAYMFFAQAMRSQVKEENPELDGHKISSLLGSMWKEMSTEEKQEYQDMAAEDKKRYEKEIFEYSGNAVQDKEIEMDDIEEPEPEPEKPAIKPIIKPVAPKKQVVKEQSESKEQDKTVVSKRKVAFISKEDLKKPSALIESPHKVPASKPPSLADRIKALKPST